MRIELGSDRFSGITRALGVGIPSIQIEFTKINIRIAVILVSNRIRLFFTAYYIPNGPSPQIMHH